jgi:dTDP-4-amino-4,6-dideoxygalactose transaminase
LFVARVPAADRDRIVRDLQTRGVGVGIHYPIPIHQQEAFRPLLKGDARFPATECLAAEILSLPVCGEITDAEVETVIDELERALDRRDG